MNKDGPFRLRWRGQTTGPHPLETIHEMLDQNQIGIWHEIEVEGEWLTLQSYLALAEQVRQQEVKQERHRRLAQPAPESPAVPEPLDPAPPPPAPVPAIAHWDPGARSAKIYAVLAFLSGFAGGHNFYAGYKGTALTQLALSVITFMLGFGFFVTWVWALVEIFVVHSDARGLRMR